MAATVRCSVHVVALSYRVATAPVPRSLLRLLTVRVAGTELCRTPAAKPPAALPDPGVGLVILDRDHRLDAPLREVLTDRAG